MANDLLYGSVRELGYHLHRGRSTRPLAFGQLSQLDTVVPSMPMADVLTLVGPLLTAFADEHTGTYEKRRSFPTDGVRVQGLLREAGWAARAGYLELLSARADTTESGGTE